MKYQGIDTCKGANMYFQGKGKCDFGCLGIGDCAAACPFGAISVKDDLAVVDRSVCTGCGVCVSSCPNHLISLIPADQTVAVRCKNIEKGVLTRKACSHGCIGCRKCEKTCKAGAITVENGFLAKVDYEKCISCGECVSVCPTGAVFLIKEGCK
jgi:Fe-S-cluster-containing hydrogenase component 2